MRNLIDIKGTSSRISFIFDDEIIVATGEFMARRGEIDGFYVDTIALKHEEKDELLSESEKNILVEMVKNKNNKSDFLVEFV